MLKKIHFLILIIGLGVLPKANAQINNLINEEIFLHYNTASILTGETLYYKLYCYNKNNNNLSSLSKIAYVELISSDKESVAKQKISIKDGVGSGDFFIPTNISSGSYKVVAYTKAMLNNNKLFEGNLLIINPFKRLNTDKVIVDTTTTNVVITNVPLMNENLLETNKKKYLNREKVTISFDSSLLEDDEFLNGQYSISVRKFDALDTLTEVPTSSNFTQNIINTNNVGLKTFLPELRGEVISGTITNYNSLSDPTLALSSYGTQFDYELTEIDKEGHFNFILSNPSTSNKIALQLLENKPIIMSLDTVLINYNALNIETPYTINTKLSETIKQRSTANQIENVFFEVKQDTIPLEVINTENFYTTLEKTYILDEYTRFKSFKETIIEIIPELFLKKKKETYTLHLRDYENKASDEVFGETLVFVDGILLKDIHQLIEYGATRIDRIELVNKGYIYGDQLYYGVVSIFTKTQDFMPISTEEHPIYYADIIRPLMPKVYFNQKYGSTTKTKIPDYRYQLLWQPTVAPKTNKSLELYTSDIKGEYIISFQGFKSDGTPITINKPFTVE
ncbi:hypothetical protein [Neptunitalea lumnitzerae]|uniref:Macroglobulin domain-containing protein n=1 Tax=Neptunitalea lumnitzerae TaxID=2965509 RepID=A0ABQ5MNH3_9FLAO|nr:hypothetical protein [Neptunitalea sp. Y10]GLB50956.1 hypothetical protein Y10_33240 [Neptunitalea sp. Y10]